MRYNQNQNEKDELYFRYSELEGGDEAAAQNAPDQQNGDPGKAGDGGESQAQNPDDANKPESSPIAKVDMH